MTVGNEKICGSNYQDGSVPRNILKISWKALNFFTFFVVPVNNGLVFSASRYSLFDLLAVVYLHKGVTSISLIQGHHCGRFYTPSCKVVIMGPTGGHGLPVTDGGWGGD